VVVVRRGGTTELCPVCGHCSRLRSDMAPSLLFFAAACRMRDKQAVSSPIFLSVLSVSLTASRPPPVPFDVLDRGVSHGTFVLASGNPTTLRLAAWRGRRGAEPCSFIQDSPQSKAPQLLEYSAHKVRQEVAVW
jgi:hypothetical protein